MLKVTSDNCYVMSPFLPPPDPHPTAPSGNPLLPAPSSYPLLPAVVSLVVVVLLLITCVTLLVLALAVTATKLNRKCHTDPLHYHSQTGGGGEGKTTERIYDEVGEGTGPIEGPKGHYQELKLGAMDKSQYETLEGTSAKA